MCSFESEVAVASEHMLSLMDASPKEVAGTTCILTALAGRMGGMALVVLLSLLLTIPNPALTKCEPSDFLLANFTIHKITHDSPFYQF